MSIAIFLKKGYNNEKKYTLKGKDARMEKTIAAIATPNAVGGISVIRVSGEEAIAVCDRCFRAVSGKPLSALSGYRASFGNIVEQGANGKETALDEVVALVYRAPKSYTGEDVVEISCHGGIYITREVLRVILQNGASLAGPGEFTKRAFLNGKLSLTQAEAVADLIASQGEQSARAAISAMQGRLYRRISEIKDSLITACGHLAAWADYPEEEIPAVEQATLQQALSEAEAGMDQLLKSFDSGRLIRTGVKTVIVGKPNVGKSTLMNLLVGCRKSIVTEIAGTTRDVIEETVSVGGIVLNLADTAGMRQTDDPVEQAGVALSAEKLAEADLVLALFDSSSPLSAEDEALMKQLEGKNVIAVINKTDLTPVLDEEMLSHQFDRIIHLSAKQETGVEELTAEIVALLKISELDPNAPMLANERQRQSAEAAFLAICEAREALTGGMTLDAVTISIETAAEALLALSGERITDAVVDEVFSHFCVGK